MDKQADKAQVMNAHQPLPAKAMDNAPSVMMLKATSLTWQQRWSRSYETSAASMAIDLVQCISSIVSCIVYVMATYQVIQDQAGLRDLFSFADKIIGVMCLLEFLLRLVLGGRDYFFTLFALLDFCSFLPLFTFETQLIAVRYDSFLPLASSPYALYPLVLLPPCLIHSEPAM
jgi:hypothetical protein